MVLFFLAFEVFRDFGDHQRLAADLFGGEVNAFAEKFSECTFGDFFSRGFVVACRVDDGVGT